MKGMNQDGSWHIIQSYHNYIGMYQDRALHIQTKIIKASWMECTKMEHYTLSNWLVNSVPVHLGMYQDRELHLYII